MLAASVRRLIGARVSESLSARGAPGRITLFGDMQTALKTTAKLPVLSAQP